MGDGALIVPSHRENKYDIYKAVKTKSSGSKSANIHAWICYFFELQYKKLPPKNHADLVEKRTLGLTVYW
jgi:hypothetical protein